MDFVIWACRVMHVVSVVVWMGGLIFINAVLVPVLQYEGLSLSRTSVAVSKRFLPFVWSSFWSLLITGFLLMVLNPRFLWFDLSTTWAKLLVAKQLSFLLLAGLSWQMRSVIGSLGRAVEQGSEEAEGWSLNLQKLVRRSLFFGILSILSAAGMAVI